MLHLRGHLRFLFTEYVKRHKNVKKITFCTAVDDPPDSAMKQWN